jgi:molybdopterin synthase catalytic subunit
MRVRVLLFARARELAACEATELELGPDARLRDAVEALARAAPALAKYLPNCRFAIDEEFQDLDAALADGARVAVVPPVSGG